MTTQTPTKEEVKLWTPVFRGSYPTLFAPRAAKAGDKEKYSIVMLFPEVFTDPAEKALFDKLRDAISAAAVKKFGPRETWPTRPVQDGKGGVIQVPAIETPWHFGVEKKDKEGFGPGIVFATASSTKKPGVLGPDGKTHLTAPDQAYGGAFYRATVHPWPWEYRQDKGGPVLKRGVSITLRNVQFVRDGEPFSGRSNPEDDFDAIMAPATSAPTPAPTGNGLGV